MKQIISPLNTTTNTKLVRTIATNEIISRYKESYDIDVTNFFVGLDTITLYECVETGFKFFQPFGVDGDSFFYEQLQKFDWYYMPWKWEHEQVYMQIKSTDKVLEIGCGPSHFIQKLQENNITSTGLELNQKTVLEAKAKGLDVRNQMIQEHALQNIEVYDVVCSFQVMEHIADIKEVILSSIKCLKKGGKLFISVPNNGSFLGLDDWNILNMPPHHMGLWNKKSLINLSKILPISVSNIFLEDLQQYHQIYFNKIVNQHIYESFQNKYGSFFGKVMNKFFKNKALQKLHETYPELKSFTIIAEYTKI